MPTKTKETDIIDEAAAVAQQASATGPDVDCHHMIQRIGQGYHQDGTIPVGEADQHVNHYLKAGYRLAHVQSLGLEPNGVNILYIFIKD